MPHLVLVLLLFFCTCVHADTYQRQADVIYGRLPGIVLTMDVFTPKQDSNGRGVLWMVSGGWSSSHESIAPPLIDMFIDPLVQRGYTVFAIVHASQPKYTIPEILPQISRAVRFVRYNAREFNIDPDHLGICGVSSGGHLSLMQGVAPHEPNPQSPDKVDHVSAAVQAVAAFVPPTDFLNFGQQGLEALGGGPLDWLRAPFQFVEPVPYKTFAGELITYERITEAHRIREIGKEISPVTHADKQDAPVLIIHGGEDRLVPAQQAGLMEARLKEVGVAHQIIIHPGKDHVWPEMKQDMQSVADWFDEHLRVGEKAAELK
jgi:acetyl esterase/lipase